MSKEDKIKVNEKEYTKEEFEKLKEEVSNSKDTTLQEVSKNVYVQRIRG